MKRSTVDLHIRGMNMKQPKRRYIKGADYTACAVKGTPSPPELPSPVLPSQCTKCRGPLGVRSALTGQGKVLEWHCPLCGKTGTLATQDNGMTLEPTKYNSYSSFLGSSDSRNFIRG